MVNNISDKTDLSSNRFSIKCIFVTVLILYVTWILNLLNIFIIDPDIFIVAIIGGTIICIITMILSYVLDLSKSYVKYILLTIVSILYGFIVTCLTYHAVIAIAFPIIYSAQYRSKKVVWFSYATTSVSIICSVICGYYFGICDANMIYYTYTRTSEFLKNMGEYSINTTPNWLLNLLFFAMPKIFVVLGIVPMVIHLNNVLETRTNKLLETQENNLKLSKELLENQQNLIVSLASVIECRDQITGDHIKNTAKYVRFLTEKLQEGNFFKDDLTEEYALFIIESAPLHDIGKIHIPDAILCKSGKLTEEEYAEMKKHPEYGVELLESFGNNVNKDYLKVVEEVCLYHHERFDGNGYPSNLKGNDIPLCARIMAVADVLDALLSKRQYKEAFSFEKSYSILKEESGKQFDPYVLDVLLSNWEEFKNDIYPRMDN
ncbi:MAG: HD-GYP domain-containing protein [Anaeroplasmataceae bacterium]